MISNTEARTKKVVVAVFGRGLDARIQWAAAQGIVDADEREATKERALELARNEGFFNYSTGRAASEVPAILADVPELADACREGWEILDEQTYGSFCVGH